MYGVKWNKMVLLTAAYIEKECSRAQAAKSLTRGIPNNHLRKMTHLYMNDKFISAIGDFCVCKNLKVIYLQNNLISSIENLNFTVNLTHLYLQHNDLTKIQKLDALRNLNCLFLGHNRINVIEGLENLDKLYELDIPNQKLPMGESLIFDPRSLNTLSIHLRILNVAGNNISSLKSLRNFRDLQTLDARNNKIDDLLDLTETVETLKSLVELSVYGNPIIHRYRYRENLIANSDSLVHLNGKVITEETRRFLKKFKDEKQLRLARKTRITLSDDITHSLKLPPAFQRSVSRAILQQQTRPTLSINVNSVSGEAKPQIHPPWKSAASIAGKRDCHFTPRPLWRTVHTHPQHSTHISDCEVFRSLLRAQSKGISAFHTKN